MNELMMLPICSHKEHGQMALRPLKHQTQEQLFCGAWYDCLHPGCICSVLFPSKELKEIYDRAQQKGEKDG